MTSVIHEIIDANYFNLFSINFVELVIKFESVTCVSLIHLQAF